MYSPKKIKEIIEDLFNLALSFCEEKLRMNRSEIIDLLKNGDRWVHDNLRYILARDFCLYFANKIPEIKSIYLHGSVMNGEASFWSDIDLLFWVDKKNKELSRLLKNIDSIFVEKFLFLMGEKPRSKIIDFLDCKIFDDDDVKKKKIDACIVNSIYEQPIKLYERVIKDC